MGPISYRVAAWHRARRRSVALLVLVVALVVAAPLALAAGARRSATAPDRYVASRPGSPDVGLFQDEGGPPLTGQVARLPSVSSASGMTFVFGGIQPVGGETPVDALVFAGEAEAAGNTVIEGRPPDPSRVDELVLSKRAAERDGLGIGDRVVLHVLSPEAVAAGGFDQDSADGFSTEAEIVGLIDGATDLDDPTAVAIFPLRLLDEPGVGISASLMVVSLAPEASIDDLRHDLDTLPGGRLLRVDSSPVVTAETRNAVATQANGLWVVAAITAIAAVVSLAYLLARSTRLHPEEVAALRATGYTTSQLQLEAAARSVLVVILGLLLGAAVAVLASPIFPFGFVRRLEPSPGLRAESLTLLAGGLVLVVAVLVVTALASRPRRPTGPERPAPAVEGLAARCPSPPLSAGLRFAFSTRGPGTLVGRLGLATVLAVAVVGTITYAMSLQRLVDDQRWWGVNYDAMIDDGADELAPDQLRLLASDPRLAAVTLYTSTQVRAQGRDATFALAGMERLRGDLEPELLEGRLPAGPEQIALGRVSARRLGASIGDDVVLETDETSTRFTVTGLIVPIGIRGNDLLGEGGLVTSAGFDRVVADSPPSSAVVDVAAGQWSMAEKLALAADLGIQASAEDTEPTPPAAIRNIGRTTYLPFVLAAVLAGLALLVALSGVYTSMRRRGGQVAVLRSLGADPGWVRRAEAWQGIASTAVPAVVGVPLGFVAGRLAFRSYADHVGTLTDALLPVLAVTAGIVVVLAFAAMASSLGGRPARRGHPAALLRAE